MFPFCFSKSGSVHCRVADVELVTFTWMSLGDPVGTKAKKVYVFKNQRCDLMSLLVQNIHTIFQCPKLYIS